VRSCHRRHSGHAVRFRDAKQVYAALDGNLGDLLRDEAATKAFTPCPRPVSRTASAITNSTRPIRTVADLKGMKLRIPRARCSPTSSPRSARSDPINTNKLYDGLKTGQVEGQENPLAMSTASSCTKCALLQPHLAYVVGLQSARQSRDVGKLPDDVRGSIERNAIKYVALQRADNTALTTNCKARSPCAA